MGEVVRCVDGDIRDLDAISRAVAEHRPEVVFHLAAQPLVRRSFREPVLTYATNVMGTVNVLEAVRRAGGVRAVVNVTSDKCYENREWVWGYREHEPMGGHDPYISSEGVLGARHRGLPRLVLHAGRRDARRLGPRRQRHRRRRLGRGPPRPRHHARRPRRRDRADPQPPGDPPLAARARPAERATCSCSSACGRTRRSPTGGTSGRPTSRRAPSTGSSSGSPRRGARASATRSIPAPTRTRRAT